MEQSELVARIEELEREIAALPPGSIATKKVKGKKYYYSKTGIGGKQHEISILYKFFCVKIFCSKLLTFSIWHEKGSRKAGALGVKHRF